MKCFTVVNGDITFKKNDIALISGIEHERQVISAVLGTNTGEWFLNENEGINFRVILTKNPDFDLIRSEIISGLNQINSDYVLASFEHTLDKERNLLLSITITRDGENITLDLNSDSKKDYVSYNSDIDSLIALLYSLVGGIIDPTTTTITYEDGVLDVVIDIDSRRYREEVEKVKNTINSIVPDYVNIEYDITVMPNPPEDFIYRIEETNEVTILQYIGKEEYVVVPQTIEDLPVTTIAAIAFANRDDVVSIQFLDGITTIE